MSKRISEEGRMVDWFAQADLAAARTMLAVLSRQVAARIQAEKPADAPTRAKRGRPANKPNGQDKPNRALVGNLGGVE